MSFLQKIIDVNDDLASGFKLAKAEMKKLAKYQVNTEPHELPDAVFGLNVITKTGGVVRKFPLKTADDTALSVWYFTKVADESLPRPAREVAATFIKAACDHHNVSPTGKVLLYSNDDIKDNAIKLADVENMPTKEYVLKDSDFALIIDGERKYPINTGERVKVAAAYFRDNWKLITPSWRNQMAENITKKAAELEVNIPHEDVEVLGQYASDRYSNILKIAIAERKNALRHDDNGYSLVLDKLMEKRASMKPLEFARGLEAFDQMTGLDQHWDSTIIDPYQSAMGGVRISEPIYVRGKAISREKIAALATNEDSLIKHFNSDFVSEFQKQPVEIFESLPTPDQELMVTLIEEKNQ